MNRAPMDILLADDNEDDIIIVQEAFADAGQANIMATVRDGEDALMYLRRDGPYKEVQQPSLLLLDINMPKKNGFEVMQAMKADRRLRSIPVIMLTMSEREEDIFRAYVCGACSYIRKPVDLDQFQLVVKQFEVYWTRVSRTPAYQPSTD